jgi:OOP family OmpA-OmpF porin
VGFALAALVASAAGPTVSSAKDSFGVEVTPYAGTAIYDSKLLMKEPLLYGGRLGLYPWAKFGFEGNYSYAKADRDSASLPDIKWQNYGGDFVWRIAPYGTVVPFLLAGIGQVDSKADTTGAESIQETAYDAGGGLLIKFNRNVGIRLDARDVMYSALGSDSEDKLRHNFVGTGGLAIMFGGAFPDDDNDGVQNSSDRCPDTPLGALVDKNGCPIDSDGDGVPDGIDQCPNTPSGATVNAQGCPSDSDNDGIFDGVDQCPGTPAGAVVDERGCPVDSDGDGVPDGLDQCPNTPAGATVDAQGCPTDADGDGVPDGLDLCPNTPQGARVDKDGCPIEVSEIETILLDTGLIRLSEVNFELGKSDIKPESYNRLNQVGQILVQWPQLHIEIGGHTDSRGSEKLNQGLSEKRAQAVLEYLNTNFPDINESQYRVVGYGESQPLVPNTSAANMAKNRRVEFKVLNTDVLKKEVERRRMLRQGEN